MTVQALRVLVVDQGIGLWGAQRYLLRLAPLMREHTIELSLAGPRSLELHNVWRECGFEALHLDLPVDRTIRKSGRPSVSGLTREGRNIPKLAGRIANLVRDGNYDIVWANSHWSHLDASFAGRMCGKPVILHLHEEAMPGMGVFLRSCAVQMADRTVAVSHGVAAGLPRIVQKRVSVIQNGIDTKTMSPATEQDKPSLARLRASLGIAPEDVMVLAATRLDPSKRIEDLVTAILSVNDPRVRLVIAGTTSAFPEYERLVIDDALRRAGSRVTFCGPRNDIADLLRASDVLIHAGLVEGMPLGVIEAQSCGVPVVAYSAAGVPEVIRDGVTGFLAPPGDADALAHQLQRVITQPALRQSMGSAARINVLARHRIELQAQRNADIIRAVCDRRRMALKDKGVIWSASASKTASGSSKRDR